MTTTTDDGLEVIGDLLIGNRQGGITALAVGSGTGSESASATALANEEHRAAVSGSNVELLESGQTGEVELLIRVKGGLEVPAGTAISEVAAFQDTEMVFVDEFAAVTVEAGNTEQFTLPVDPQRS
jgi:outer membrane lipoprotein SlyB